MAKKSFLAPCLVIIGIVLSHGCVQASEDLFLFSVGIKSGFQLWEVGAERYRYRSADGYESSLLSSWSSERGEGVLTLGPEIAFCYKGAYIRTFYVQGEGDFPERGVTTRRYAGLDIGIMERSPGGRAVVATYFGFRHARAEFLDWTDDRFSDQNVSGVTLGVYLGTDMTRPGFQFALEGAFSPLLIPYAIVQGFTFGKWNPEVLEWADRSIFIDSQLRAGYAVNFIPLEVRFGFEVSMFGKPIEELEEGNIVRLDCVALGGSLGLAYYF
jgi:hypothetical protein